MCIQLLAATVVSSNGCAATKQLCSHQVSDRLRRHCFPSSNLRSMVYESEEAKAALECLGARPWGVCIHSDELLLLFHRRLHSLLHDVNLPQDRDMLCAGLMEVLQ